MAISLRAAGAYVSGTANITPTIPSGAVEGDLMLLLVGTKPYNGTNNVPGDWTLIGEATDGTVAAGVDVGSMKVEAWYKVHTGTESNPLVTNSTNNVSGAIIMVFQNATGAWNVAGAGGGDNTAGTGFSVTAGSNPGITADDLLCAFAAFRSDAANPGTPSITASGATIGSVTKSPATDLSTTSGGDMDMTTGYAAVTAGTATAAPVYSATLAAAHTGSAYIIRMREMPGAQTITAPLLSNSNTLYEPSVIPGSVSITTPLLSSSVLSEPVYDTDVVANTANSLSLTSVPAGALLVLAVAQNDDGNDSPYCTVTSSPSLTWTNRAEAETSASGTAHIYTATFTAGGSITVNAEWGPNTHAQCVAALYAVEGGSIGNTASETAESTPQTSLTTGQDNSLVIGVISDWNTIDGASRVYRRASTETVYNRQTNLATIYHFYRREPTAGTYDYGVSSPTGQASGCVYIEVRQSAEIVLYPPSLEQGGGTPVLALPALASVAALYAPSLVPGPVTVTLSALSAVDALHTPSLVPGPVALTLPALPQEGALYAPSLVLGAPALTLPLLPALSQLYSPSLVPGPVALTLPVLPAVDALYPPSLQASIILTTPALGSAAVLYPPSLALGTVQLTLPALAKTDALHAPTLVPGAVALTLPLLPAISDLYPPSLVIGGLSLTLPKLGSTDTLYAPFLQPGPVSLVLPVLGSVAQLYAPSLALSTTALTLPALAAQDALYAPSLIPGAVALTLPLLPAVAQLYAPSIATGAALSLPHLGSTDTLYSPSLVPGPVTVTIPALTSVAVLYAPSLGTGAVNITLPLLPGVDLLHPPSLQPGAINLTLSILNSIADLYPPALFPVQRLTLPLLPQTDALYPPILAGEGAILGVPYLASVSQLYTPELLPKLLYVQHQGQRKSGTLLVGRDGTVQGTGYIYRSGQWLKI